jgi:RNA ligase
MHISDLAHLRVNPKVKFKIEHGVEIVSYMIADNELWQDPAALETRGNAYDVTTGQCVCATFPKFFNLNEQPSTQENLVKNQIKEIYVKRDGSMITPVLINGQVLFKTKKTFENDVTKLATRLVTANIIALCEYLLKQNVTPIFEFTHADTKIVINYHDANFTLLAARSQISGEFVPYEMLDNLCQQFEVNIIERVNKTWDQLIDDVDNLTGVEGYVLLLNNSQRVKIKTHWYLNMHYVLTELRERDIARAVIAETVDDLKGIIVERGLDIALIDAIEQRVVGEILDLQTQVNDVISQHVDWSFKDLAIKFKNNPLMNLIMRTARGQEPDYKKFWLDNYIDKYSLHSVYNERF